jgi:hypothetical protein
MYATPWQVRRSSLKSPEDVFIASMAKEEEDVRLLQWLKRMKTYESNAMNGIEGNYEGDNLMVRIQGDWISGESDWTGDTPVPLEPRRIHQIEDVGG